MFRVTGMVQDYMQRTPVENAVTTIRISVVQRFISEDPGPQPQPTAFDPVEGTHPVTIGGDKPRVRIVIRQRREFSRELTTGADGIVTAEFDLDAAFQELDNGQSSVAEFLDVVAVVRIDVSAGGVAGSAFFHRSLHQVQGPDLYGKDAIVQKPIYMDFAKLIIGHTTETTATIWMALHGWQQNQRYELEVSELPRTLVMDRTIVGPHGAILPAPRVQVSSFVAPRRIPLTFLAQDQWTSTEVLAQLRPSTRYALRLLQYESSGVVRILATGSFTTATPGAEYLRFAFSSCHFPYQSNSLIKWDQLAQDPHEILLLLGDQIYGDGLRPDGQDWLRPYVDRYHDFWSARSMRSVISQTPTYMICDDHEVVDDWGTGFDDRDVVNQRRISDALQAYRLFQQAHNPGGVNGSLHYSFERGPAAFFVLDVRSKRIPNPNPLPAHPVLGTSQLSDFQKWAQLPSTRNADVIVVACPVPIAFLPVEEILRLLQQARNSAGVVGGGVLGAIGGLVAGPLGATAGAVIGYQLGQAYASSQIKESGLDNLLTNDLADMWTQKDNQVDLVAVLDVLFDLANDVDQQGNPGPHRRAVILLGGDVHCAAVHVLRSNKNQHRGNACIYQVIASAVSTSPPREADFEEIIRHIQNGKSITVSDLVTSRGDFSTLAKNNFGTNKAKFVLDDRLGSNYAADLIHLHVGRSIGSITVQKMQSGPTYRIRMAVDVNDGQGRSIHAETFDLKLDDAFVTARGV